MPMLFLGKSSFVEKFREDSAPSFVRDDILLFNESILLLLLLLPPLLLMVRMYRGYEHRAVLYAFLA